MFGYSCNFLAHKHTAQYSGGFKMVNGRLNNTPAYNSDYYEKNKEKWPEYPSQKPGKHEAPKENKGGKMGNGMPSNIPSGKSESGNKSTLDILDQMKKERDAHDAEIVAKRDSKFVAEDEEGGSGKGGSGKKSGGSGKGSAAEKEPKQEKSPKAEKGTGGGGGGSSKDDKKKSKDDEKEESKRQLEEAVNKRRVEEETRKAQEENWRKEHPIDDDNTLSDKEKDFYKGVANMATLAGVSVQSYVNKEGIDSLFSRFFTDKNMDPKKKEEIKKKFIQYYSFNESLKHGWVARRKSDELYHGGLAMGKLYNLYSNGHLKHSASGLIGRGASRVTRSKYSGGFVMKNNRMNNSKEYNHDYYIRNKEKWKQMASKGETDSSSSSGNLHKPYEWYSEKGEKYFYGDWTEDKTNYVLNSPSFQKVYKQAEKARDAYERTGLPSYKAAVKKYSALVAEESIRLGKEYDNKKKPTVSKEYQEELEYNSRRNRYR